MIFAIANQKGGTGKSTTAATTAAGLTKRGYKALLIDLDPQGNTSFSFGAETGSRKNIFSILSGSVKAAEAVQTTAQGNIIVSAPELATADLSFNGKGGEYLLQTALKPLKRLFDYIIIDCPPSLGILTINALTAADRIILTATADVYSLQGLTQIYKTIAAVQAYSNKALKVEGLLLTQYNGRTTVSREIREALQITAAKQLNSKVFNATIRNSTKVKEAQIKRMSLFDYAPKATVTADYNLFIDELLTD